MSTIKEDKLPLNSIPRSDARPVNGGERNPFLDEEFARFIFPGNIDDPASIYKNYLSLFYKNSTPEGGLFGSGTDARDFAYSMLGKSADYFSMLEQRNYNRAMQEDQRKYDNMLLQNQRAYDSPQAVIERLMSTGMSRTAAMQAAAGSLNSSAVSSGTALTSPEVPASNYGAGVSAASHQHTANVIAGIQTALSTVGGIMGLVSTGVNVANALKQKKLLENNIFTADMEQRAMDTVGQFVGSIYSKSEDGVDYARPDFNKLSTADEWLSWASSPERVKDNPSVYEWSKSASARDFASNPFAWSLFDTWFGNHSNARQSENTEIAALNARLLQVQTDLAGIDLKSELLDYDWSKLKFEDYGITRDTVNAYSLTKFRYDFDLLRQTSDPETLKLLVDKYKNDALFNSINSALHAKLEQGLTDFSLSNPEYRNAMEMCYFLDQLGFGGTELGNIVKVVGMGKGINDGINERNGFNVLGNFLSKQSEKVSDFNSGIKKRMKDTWLYKMFW